MIKHPEPLQVLRVNIGVSQVKRLYAQVAKEQMAAGRRVTVSDVVRRLIDEKLPPEK